MNRAVDCRQDEEKEDDRPSGWGQRSNKESRMATFRQEDEGSEGRMRDR